MRWPWRRMVHGDPRPARTLSSESSNRFFSGFFYEAVVQHVTYVTDFCGVGRVVHPSWGTTPRKFKFSGTSVVAALATCQLTREEGAIIDICTLVWWFLVRLLLFHCMPAGRHSDSTRDRRRVRLCSRLPCGPYGAGIPTAVVRSRELVSCGNGGTLCRS